MPRVAASKAASPVTIQVNPTEQQPPPPPAALEEKPELPPTWFWDKISEIPLDEWGRVYDLVLQRTGDRKVPMLDGEKGYLATYVKPVTLAEIKGEFGGGKYIIALERNGRYVTSHTFEIAGQSIYSSRERAGHPAAAAAAPADGPLMQQFVNMLRDELQRSREQGGGAAGVTERALDLITDAAKRSNEIVTKQTPQAEGPTAALREMIGAIKDMGLLGGAQHSTLGSLVTEITPLITLLTPLLGKFFTPSDPLSQVTQFMSLMDKLDELRGKAGGGGRGTTTNDLLLAGIEQLPKVLNEMGQQKAQALEHQQRQLAVGARVSHGTSPLPPAGAPTPHSSAAVSPAAQPQARGGAATPPLSPLRVVPLSERTSPGPLAEATVGAVGAPTNLSPSVPYNPTQDLKVQYDEWVKLRVVEMIAMGFPGEQIAASLDVWKPEMIRELAQRSEQEIEAIFSLDPVLAQVVKHPNCRPAITAAKAEAEAILEDAEESGDGVPEKVM